MKSRQILSALAIAIVAACSGGASGVTPDVAHAPNSRYVVQLPAFEQLYLNEIVLPDSVTAAVANGSRVAIHLPSVTMSKIPLRPSDCPLISGPRGTVRPEYSVCSTPGPDPCAGVCGLPPSQCMDCVSGGAGNGGSGGIRDISQGAIWQNGQFEVLCGNYSMTSSGTATAFGINSTGATFAGTFSIPAGKETWGFWIPSAAPGGNAISITITGPAGTATCGGTG